MKIISILLFCCGILLACNSESKKGSAKESTDKKETADLSTNPDYQKGLALVAKAENKCLTCHNVDQRITGPSYREVANRYADRPDTIIPHLARKVRNGGNGEWGEIYMTPNTSVSQEDAEAMVKYILLLKK